MKLLSVVLASMRILAAGVITGRRRVKPTAVVPDSGEHAPSGTGAASKVVPLRTDVDALRAAIAVWDRSHGA